MNDDNDEMNDDEGIDNEGYESKKSKNDQGYDLSLNVNVNLININKKLEDQSKQSNLNDKDN
jgi:hypothetical protein